MSQVEKVISVLNKNFPADGLLPIYINPDTANPSYSTITFGAMGDRFFSNLIAFYITARMYPSGSALV